MGKITKYIIMLVSICTISLPVLADKTSQNKGNWTNGSNWIGGSAPVTNNIDEHITINGHITRNGDLTYRSGGNSRHSLNVNDTLIVYGDVYFGLDDDVTIGNNSVFIVYGNFTSDNQVHVENGGYFIVTGDLNMNGGASGFDNVGDGKTFIIGDVNPPGGNGSNWEDLDCDPDVDYPDCYGNSTHLEDDPINEIFQQACEPKPAIYWMGSNSPLTEGNTLNLQGSAGAGNGASTVNYAWTGPLSYTSTAQNPSRASVTPNMAGHYKLTVSNEFGCTTSDSVNVSIMDACCDGAAYFSKDNYTGNWNDINSWASPDEGWRPLPPPTDGSSNQKLCVKGYITLNGNYTATNTDVIICDTLVITGNLEVNSMSLTVADNGILIVLGDFISNNGSLTNNGEIVFAGNFDKPYSYSFDNDDEIYVFDDDPNSQGFTPTGDENDLENNNPDLFDFYNDVMCGSGISGGTITADQSVCPGEDVAAFTSTASASPSAGVSYQWYASTNSSNPNTGTWNTIAGATSETYDHDTLSQTTYFHRKATWGSGCSANSNTTTITTYNITTPSISGDNFVCEHENGIVYSTQSGMNNYNWNIAGGIITSGGGINDDNASVTWTNAGTRNITVNYEDANGCVADSDADVAVTVNYRPLTENVFKIPNN